MKRKGDFTEQAKGLAVAIVSILILLAFLWIAIRFVGEVTGNPIF